MFTIVMTEKGGKPTARVFNKAEVTIGRDSANDIAIPRANISKRHARIICERGVFVVIDNKSTNGTFINGRRIDAPYDLKVNERVVIGDYAFELSNEASKGASLPDEAPPPMRPATMSGEPTLEEPVHGLFARKPPAPPSSVDDWGDPVAAARNASAKQSTAPTPSVDGDWGMPMAEGQSPAIKQSAAPTPSVDGDWGMPMAEGQSPAIKKASAPAPSVDDDWGQPVIGGSEMDMAAMQAPRSEPPPVHTPKPTPVKNDWGVPEAFPMPPTVATSVEPAKASAGGSTSVQRQLVRCLQRYVEADEAYRERTLGSRCSCGKCLLCESRRLLAALPDE